MTEISPEQLHAGLEHVGIHVDNQSDLLAFTQFVQFSSEPNDFERSTFHGLLELLDQQLQSDDNDDVDDDDNEDDAMAKHGVKSLGHEPEEEAGDLVSESKPALEFPEKVADIPDDPRSDSRRVAKLRITSMPSGLDKLRKNFGSKESLATLAELICEESEQAMQYLGELQKELGPLESEALDLVQKITKMLEKTGVKAEAIQKSAVDIDDAAEEANSEQLRLLGEIAELQEELLQLQQTQNAREDDIRQEVRAQVEKEQQKKLKQSGRPSVDTDHLWQQMVQLRADVAKKDEQIVELQTANADLSRKLGSGDVKESMDILRNENTQLGNLILELSSAAVQVESLAGQWLPISGGSAGSGGIDNEVSRGSRSPRLRFTGIKSKELDSATDALHKLASFKQRLHAAEMADGIGVRKPDSKQNMQGSGSTPRGPGCTGMAPADTSVSPSQKISASGDEDASAEEDLKFEAHAMKLLRRSSENVGEGERDAIENAEVSIAMLGAALLRHRRARRANYARVDHEPEAEREKFLKRIGMTPTSLSEIF
eukprot:gnl/MRDRNA2_/MRDRNA2_131872_c0_seq1.p1 gnl/MRDRNA2_/MRDRNA2_131872_c0~~gnl/MRDRNA2_/MRDRNA2_131872_c0_seq1.p1  ORF type:complete len:606 (+),score=186.10 gnl/MRDRNA2_/MRDRNA2_131872_c0_seq1:191-1819(+)